MTIPFHTVDAAAIPSANPAVVDYIEEVERLGAAGPEPAHQVAYGTDPGQRLDVYAPPGANNLPVLVFFHGGAWVNGHLGWLRFMAEPVLAQKAILIAGTYRLAPRHRWPAQIDDVAKAVRFVHAHTAKWGGNPNRIVTSGHSAGGHLASLAALTRPGPKLAACFPVSCPFSLQHGDVPLESEQGRVYRYLFNHRSEDADASPIQFAGLADIPFHIVWGDRDLDHVSRSSSEMVARLESDGKPVSHAVLHDSSHFDSHLSLGDPASPWYQRLGAAFSKGF